MKNTLQPNNETTVPRLGYSLQETALALGISYISVYRLVKRGKLRAVDALRHKIVPASEIKKFLGEAA